LDANVILELNGGQHAECVKAQDNYRAQRMEALGYRVLRFWNDEVLTNTEAVPELILEAVARAAPLPSPFPRGERE
jgi:very-short-patch-repair endonuclease